MHFCHFEQTRKLFSDPPISKYGAKSLQKTSRIFFFRLIFSCHVKRWLWIFNFAMIMKKWRTNKNDPSLLARGGRKWHGWLDCLWLKNGPEWSNDDNLKEVNVYHNDHLSLMIIGCVSDTDDVIVFSWKMVTIASSWKSKWCCWVLIMQMMMMLMIMITIPRQSCIMSQIWQIYLCKNIKKFVWIQNR